MYRADLCRKDSSGGSSSNTAIGRSARAAGDNSANTASGALANAEGLTSFNTATGNVAKAQGNGSSNVATGNNANASGDGSNNTAVGADTIATGLNSAAFGFGAQAAFANATAIGPGAVATAADQMTFGNASVTAYRFQTLPAIAGASSDKLVTVDASGFLRTIAAPTPVTVINDLVTGGATAALSAQQGVVLNGLVSTAQSTANNALALASTALQADGSVIATGNLNMGGFQINNVAAPTLGTDAANKTYVDGQVTTANANSAAAQATANTALTNAATAQTTANGAATAAAAAQTTANTGVANAAAAQTTANGAATAAAAAQTTANGATTAASTAQTTANGALQRTGGTMTGTINMGGNTITNVAGPVTASDAANKGYVDAQIASLTGFGGVQSQIDALGRKDQDLAEGIAIAVALDAPQLRAGQTFAVRGGWGNFEGSNALALTAAGLVASNFAGQGSSAIIDVGVGFGTSNNTTATRAGVTIGW